MASLDLATLKVEIEADSSEAIRQIRQTGEAAQQAAAEAEAAEKGYHKNAAGRWVDAKGRFVKVGEAAVTAAGTAADAFEKAGATGAEQVEGFSKKATTSLKDVSKQLTEIGGSMTLKVTAPIIAAFTASVKGASDLNETVSKTGEVFKEQSDQVMDWSEGSIESMGLAQGTALDMASTFGDMGTSMGQTRAEASEMSTSLVQLAADMASFKNISTDRAATALTAIYTGETEALKSLGIVMTQANLEAFALSQGITTQISAMSQAEQVQLRYQYVMAQTANAQDDFARTGGSLANQGRKLVQSIKQLGESFGKLLLPAVTSVVTTIQGAVQWLTEDDSGLKQVILTIAGVVAAIGPLLLVGGKVIQMIDGIKKALTVLMAHPIILAVTAAAAALGLLAIKLGNVDEEAIRASGSYQRLKAAVEGGVEGAVSVDTSQLDALNADPPKLIINADVSNALTTAKSVATELTKPEYAGEVAIDGDTAAGQAALTGLLAAIDAAEAAITIDGDGNAVIGDAGVISQLETAIANAEGILPISVDSENYADVLRQLGALKESLSVIDVSIDTSQLDALNADPPKLAVNADVSNALEAAKGIATELTKPEYAGEIAIDGDTAAGSQALTSLVEAINAAEAAITIDGDGNAVVGDAGVVQQLEDAIANAKGILPISINSEDYATVSGQLDGLKRQLALVDVNIDISSDKAAFDAEVDAFKAKLDNLGYKAYGGYGEFTVSDSTAEEIKEYSDAIMAAAQAVGDYDDAVSNLDALTDRQLAESVSEINTQTSEQVASLARARNSGILTDEEYMAQATAVIEAGKERIGQLEAEADLARELHQVYADGSEANDASAAARQALELTGGQGVTQADAMQAQAELAAAADAGKNMTQYQTEAMIVNKQLADQAIANYDAMIAAQQAYDSALSEANSEEERKLGINEKSAETYRQVSDALGQYSTLMFNSNLPAAERLDTVMANFTAQAPEVQELIRSMLTTPEGTPADWITIVQNGEAITQLLSDTEAERTTIQQEAKDARLAAEQAFADAMTAITSDMTTEELQLLLQLTASTGMAMSQVDQNLVLGMQSAAEGMVAELSSGRDDAAREVSGLISDIGKETGDARSQGVPVGEAIINGIIAGCNNRGGALSSTIRSLVRAGIDAGEEEGQINSPSKVTAKKIGEPLMEGIEFGFANRLPQALKTIRSGMDNLMTGAAKVVNHGTYTAPALPAVSRSVTTIDYDRLADAVAQRPSYFNVGARQLAQATDEATARAQAGRQRSVAIGYGLAR